MSLFSVIQGIVKIKGDTDGTKIGNVGDSIKTQASVPDAQRSAFGDNMVESMQPISQISAVYGLTEEHETFNASTGTVGTNDSMFECSTGTGIGGYGVVRTKKSTVYREGQGLMGRFTAIFDGNAVANSLQFAGLYNLTDSIAFGYRGANFGIIFDNYGNPEIRTLTVTSSGNGNLTVTLDGTAYVVPITSGSVQQNAAEIADWMENNQSVWSVQQDDDKVIFQAQDTSSRNGTYSISGTTLAGTFSQNLAGIAKTEKTILRADWDNNPAWYNPNTPNVYMIKVSYLGFGPIKFFIMNNTTGEFELVHTEKFIGTATKPSISKRSLKIGWICASLGSTTALTVKGACAATFIEGDSKNFGNLHSSAATNASVGSSYVSILAVKAKNVFNNEVMLGRIIPIRLAISNDATKPVEFVVVKNGDYGLSNYVNHGNDSIALDDLTSFATQQGTNHPIDGGVMNAGGTSVKDLKALGIDLQLNETLIVYARKTSGTNPAVTARLTWTEDF